MRCVCAATRSGTGSPATSTRPCARSSASISCCGRPPRNGNRSPIAAYSVLERAFCGEGSRTLGSNWLSITASRPPGRNTRIHSSIAASGCGSVHSTWRVITRSKLASENCNASASPSSKRTARLCSDAAFRRASASICGAKSTPVTRCPRPASSRLRNPVPQPTSSASRGARPPTARATMRSQAARSASVRMLCPKSLSNPAARRFQCAATCCFTSSVSAIVAPLFQSGQLGERFDLLLVAAGRVQQQMIGALGGQRLELLGDLLGGAVNAAGIDPRRIFVDDRKPAQEFLARNIGPLMHAEKDTLRDRESLGVAPLRRQRFLQDRYRLRKRLLARPARAHPAIGEPRRAAQRVGMADAHPDRRARLLHRLWRHRLVFEVVEGAVIGDLVFCPQRLDEVHLLAEATHPALFRHLKLAVMVVAAEPHPANGAAIADVIETRPLMRHHQRAVDR